MEGRPKTAGSGSLEELVDISDNVETRGQESLHALIYLKIPSVDTEVGTRHKVKLAGGQEAASRGGGIRGGDTVGFVPPSSPGSLAPDQGVVQGCG